MLSHVLNQRHSSWLVFALLMLCLIVSYILTQYQLYKKLEVRVNDFDNFYSERLESADRSLLAVEQVLKNIEVGRCSQGVVTSLKDYILTSDALAIVWVNFIDEPILCSALGVSQLPDPKYYPVIASMGNGLKIYQKVDSDNPDERKPVYVGRHTEQYRWFIGIDVLSYIQEILKNCEDCGALSIQFNSKHELFRKNKSAPYWGAMQFNSEVTGLTYRFSLNLYSKALLWLTHFVGVIAISSMFFVGWLLLRGVSRQYYWHRLFLKALKKKEFNLVYQPVFDNLKQEVIGVEVLLRWLRPDGTTRNTGEFIGILEKDPIMPEVTRWVVKMALNELKEQLDGKLIGWCSINVSAMEIEQGQMLPFLRELVEEGYPVEYLSFELTERIPMNNWQQLEDFIKACQALGCKVKLDDVGTGYGGSLCLQNLDFDYLKIDQQFVGHLGTPESKLSLIESYIAIAKELNISVIAEGVETLEQAEILKTLGVNLQQGWLYSKALPARELEAYLLKAT
ncbi:EAL domain-containing protein [Shewanella pealeana]|uniref:Diguanylate phosphodiesterase n=1 Tax=Shewanella pealeana (strain ATCC 700345 / ANG-SQ1) TaxID=398579 RepID=A8H1Y3_SHEPA|nr:EAL domain-containing protein [Shewanella pealeana]ABV86570.1 diguanylate phosphodiesterase [Shewanella pealeana ATCC 700345]